MKEPKAVSLSLNDCPYHQGMDDPESAPLLRGNDNTLQILRIISGIASLTFYLDIKVNEKLFVQL